MDIALKARSSVVPTQCAGAQIAATSGVNGDVPPGARWGGIPARPMREWFREITALKKLASQGDLAKEDKTPSQD